MSSTEAPTVVTNVTAVARAVDAVKVYGSGDTEVRAPEDCAILMPARKAIPGREGVYIARPL